MTDLHTALSLLQGSTLLAPVYGLDVEPGEQQRALLARILTHILGGQSPTLAPGAAGTGKTTMIRLLLRMLLDAGLRVVVATPTHKARTRVEETLGDVGVEVVTHHSLWCGGAVEEIEEGEEYADDLHLSPAETPRDHPYDVVVVDEASMLTTSDLFNLSGCLRENCVIVGTGDHHQLPPVGGPAGFDWSGADDYGLTKRLPPGGRLAGSRRGHCHPRGAGAVHFFQGRGLCSGRSHPQDGGCPRPLDGPQRGGVPTCPGDQGARRRTCPAPSRSVAPTRAGCW